MQVGLFFPGTSACHSGTLTAMQTTLLVSRKESSVSSCEHFTEKIRLEVKNHPHHSAAVLPLRGRTGRVSADVCDLPPEGVLRISTI